MSKSVTIRSNTAKHNEKAWTRPGPVTLFELLNVTLTQQLHLLRVILLQLLISFVILTHLSCDVIYC